MIFNPFNGAIVLGNCATSGYFYFGLRTQPLKPLFDFCLFDRYFNIGLMALYLHKNRHQLYKESFLDLLNQHFQVTIKFIDPENYCEEIEVIDWQGHYRQSDRERPQTIVIRNKQGAYVGDPLTAYRLLSRGIVPETAEEDDTLCSIGFSAQEQKWYGWSHRTIAGFAIGDIAKEGDCVTTSGWVEEYLIEHPEADKRVPVGFEAKTLEDCKTLAIAYAESVG